MTGSFYDDEIGSYVRRFESVMNPLAVAQCDRGVLIPMDQECGAASVEVCTLLDKRARRIVDVPIKYVGFEVPDEFLVGYGLDYQEKYRNLPFIGVLRPEGG